MLLAWWRAFHAGLNDDEKARWDHCLGDGRFAPVKGARRSRAKHGKGSKWMLLVDGAGTPLGGRLDAANPSQRKLLTKPLAAVQVRRSHRPRRLRSKSERLI